MSPDSEDQGRLRPVKIHGVVVDEHGARQVEPVAPPPGVRLVRELKGAGAAGRTLTREPGESAPGRLVPGPGAAAAGDPSGPTDGQRTGAAEPATGVVRFFLRLLGRDAGID